MNVNISVSIADDKYHYNREKTANSELDVELPDDFDLTTFSNVIVGMLVTVKAKYDLIEKAEAA